MKLLLWLLLWLWLLSLWRWQLCGCGSNFCCGCGCGRSLAAAVTATVNSCGCSVTAAVGVSALWLWLCLLPWARKSYSHAAQPQAECITLRMHNAFLHFASHSRHGPPQKRKKALGKLMSTKAILGSRKKTEEDHMKSERHRATKGNPQLNPRIKQDNRRKLWNIRREPVGKL